MKNIEYKTILVLFLAVVSFNPLLAQDPDPPVKVLNTDETGDSYIHTARDKIIFEDGYIYEATSSFSMQAYTDETILLSADYIDGDPPVAENRELDHSLEVGTLPGAPSVSQTGAANYTIPIEVPPGTNGMQPNLSVIYNSQGGNGILGMKWQLAGLSAISRIGHTIYHDGETRGIQFTTEDNLALDGNRLILASGTHWTDGAVYHTEIESYSQITYNDPGSGSSYFSVTKKDGTVIEYGNTTKSRVESNGGNTEALLWLINKITDPFENYMEFVYFEDVGQGEYYIEKIKYTQNDASSPTLDHYNEVQFYYSERLDKSMRYINGSMRNDKKVLRKIKTFCCSSLALEYNFTYDLDQYTHLVEVQKVAYDGKKYNSTIFEWGTEGTSFVQDGTDLSLGFERVLVGDFTCNGLGDIFCQNSSNLWELYSWDPMDNEFSSSYSSIYNTLPANIVDILPGDFDGNGTKDVIVFYKDGIWIKACIMENLGGTFCQNNITNFDYHIGCNPEFRIGDFNGDGISNVAVLAGQYIRLFEYHDAINDELNQFSEYNHGESLTGFHIRDFNGDKCDDFLCISNNSTSLRTYNGSTSLYEITPLGYPNSLDYVLPGDFNGDGNCDILTYRNGIWSLGISIGNTFDTGPQYPQAPFQGTFTNSDPNNSDHQFFTIDANGDGKDDIYQLWHVGNYVHFEGVYSLIGDDWMMDYHTTSCKFTPMNKFHFSDINGDGSVDIFKRINTNNDNYGVWFHKPFQDRNRVLHISNGMDHQTSFEYKPCTDPEVYGDMGGENYPLNDVVAPYWVVQNMITDNPLGANNTDEYFYRGAKIHRQGLGFLGFYSVKSTDLTSDISVYTKYKIDDTRYLPYMTYQKTEIKGITSTLLSEVSIEETDMEFKDMTSVFGCNTFAPLVKKRVEHNALQGTTKETVTTYDDYANLLTQTVSYLNGASIEWSETLSYDENSFSSENTFYPCKPGKISINRNNLMISDIYSYTIDYIYDGTTGALVSKISNDGDPLELTTTYSYNGFGNVTGTEFTPASSSGLSSRSKIMIYDDNGRFVKSSKNALQHEVNFTHNPKYGTLLSITDPNGLTFMYEYNSFGRKTKEISPSGQKTEFELDWYIGSDIPYAKYYTSTTVEDGGTSTKYFNSAGQVLKSAAPSLNGTVCSDFHYNAQGQLTEESYPYFESIGSSSYSTSFTYTDWGTVETQTTPTNTITYWYPYGTLITNKSVSPLNITTSRSSDAMGNTHAHTDVHGNTMVYTYNNQGLPSQIAVNSPGATLSTVGMDYDQLGNQTKLDDPNAGLTSYTYNAFGDLINQTDARGNTYNFTYDQLGRMTDRNNNATENTSYLYDTKPNGIGMIATITHSNGTSVDYSYDELTRLSKISETIDGTAYTHSYAYNKLGQMVREEYPSGFAIRNQYNAEGFLDVITNNTGSTLWQASEVNEFGNFIEYVLGNNKLTCTQEYDALGFLEGISAENHATPQETVQNLEYEFSQSYGNLDRRKDLLNPILIEDFDYDSSTETKLESSQVGSGDIYTTWYGASGNITNKTDAGSYTYTFPGKPHAVNGITGNPGTIPSLDQDISYTPFNKVSTIEEGIFEMNFSYGHDRLRRKTQLYENSTLKKTKYFVGNYEKVINETTGAEREYHYLSAHSGLFAVVTRIDGCSEELNYVLTDHLGSIQTITDDEGESPTSFSLGPWGRLRNASTWGYSNPCDLPFFGRGYTGHEHLLEFGLVNMNGRLYDPVLGRMLSPDNFVQMSRNSQNFNRYSYCLNNPLVYKDPSGEFLLAAAAAWLVLSETGYEMQKKVSPIALHIDPKFGTHQRSLGFDISVGVPKMIALSYRYNYGKTYYWSTYGNNSGWETRKGGEWTLFGKVNFSGTSFSGAGYPREQTNNTITLGGPFANLKYENDTYLGNWKLPGVPQGDPGSDAYRTAASRIKYGPWSVGMILHTGEADDDIWYDLNCDGCNDTQAFSGGNISDPNLSHGIFYVGFGPWKIGWDSEGIRHTFQNKLAHDGFNGGNRGSEYPWILKLDRDPRLYLQFGWGNGSTLY